MRFIAQFVIIKKIEYPSEKRVVKGVPKTQRVAPWAESVAVGNTLTKVRFRVNRTDQFSAAAPVIGQKRKNVTFL